MISVRSRKAMTFAPTTKCMSKKGSPCPAMGLVLKGQESTGQRPAAGVI